MELGIDIAGLSVVHIRNVPNTANYANVPGRAGKRTARLIRDLQQTVRATPTSSQPR